MSAIDKAEIASYLELDEDELFSLMVPENIRQQGYSKKGIVARGKSIFAMRLKAAREVVCGNYNKLDDKSKHSIDLVVLVANTLLALEMPALPMAVLIVKIGLDKLCDESKWSGNHGEGKTGKS
jgi:hypothetical protein